VSFRDYTVKMKYSTLTGPVRMHRYADGTPCLLMAAGDSRPEVLSINLTAYNLTPPEGHVYVKNYGEHEGLPDALVEAGVAEKVYEVGFGPYDATAWLMRVVA
jgi:hypothetical protein